MESPLLNRRPIRVRETAWAKAIAQKLVHVGVKPNQVSILSVVCATTSGMCLVGGTTAEETFKAVLLIAAAVFIQLRLLCNLFDGMIAVEGGLKSKSGEIYNDLPDRLADPLILVCAGYSITESQWGDMLGWAAGLLAVMTAYVRVLGVSAGASSYFCGPMAKQHRMALVTVACLIAAVETMLGWKDYVMPWTLGVISIGCIFTIARRTFLIVRKLELK